MRLLNSVAAVSLLALASLAHGEAPKYENAEILAIQPRTGSSGVHKQTDAPPPSSEADYDVTVKIGDKDYVGRYRHASDYVPSNWEVGKTVPGRVGRHRHRIYLKDMAGKEVAMPIVSRQPAK